MIVSERAPGSAPSLLFAGRRSEPSSISVWGLPGSVWASSVPSFSSGRTCSAFTTRSTSRKAATAVAPADANTTSTAPIRSRFQRPGRMWSSSIG